MQSKKHRKLCEIRAEEQTLADGDLQFSDTTASALLRYERTSGDSRLVIVVNRGHQYAETKIDALYALDLLSRRGLRVRRPGRSDRIRPAGDRLYPALCKCS